ncbi:MAG: hypothetical protein JWO22_1786 [Frankiales bacterium]|nr:hypothetical protein [Frankiales bacterium]
MHSKITSDSPGKRDWYGQAVQRVEDEARRLKASVDAAALMLKTAAEQHRDGADLPDVIGRLVAEGGRTTRRSSATAFAAFEAAVTSYRSQVVTALVDQHDMTYTEIARLIGVSRQMVARLHRMDDLDVTQGCDHRLP